MEVVIELEANVDGHRISALRSVGDAIAVGAECRRAAAGVEEKVVESV